MPTKHALTPAIAPNRSIDLSIESRANSSANAARPIPPPSTGAKHPIAETRRPRLGIAPRGPQRLEGHENRSCRATSLPQPGEVEVIRSWIASTVRQALKAARPPAGRGRRTNAMMPSPVKSLNRAALLADRVRHQHGPHIVPHWNIGSGPTPSLPWRSCTPATLLVPAVRPTVAIRPLPSLHGSDCPLYMWWVSALIG